MLSVRQGEDKQQYFAPSAAFKLMIYSTQKGKKKQSIIDKTKLYLPEKLQGPFIYLFIYLFNHIQEWANSPHVKNRLFKIDDCNTSNLRLKFVPQMTDYNLRKLQFLPSHQIFSGLYFSCLGASPNQTIRMDLNRFSDAAHNLDLVVFPCHRLRLCFFSISKIYVQGKRQNLWTKQCHKISNEQNHSEEMTCIHHEPAETRLVQIINSDAG